MHRRPICRQTRRGRRFLFLRDERQAEWGADGATIRCCHPAFGRHLSTGRNQAACPRSIPDTLRPEFHCPAARRAEYEMSCRCQSGGTAHQAMTASRETFLRAMASVSTACSHGSCGSPILPSSKFRNFMSNAALWMISLTVTDKIQKRLTYCANLGLSRRKSSPNPCT